MKGWDEGVSQLSLGEKARIIMTPGSEAVCLWLYEYFVSNLEHHYLLSWAQISPMDRGGFRVLSPPTPTSTSRSLSWQYTDLDSRIERNVIGLAAVQCFG